MDFAKLSSASPAIKLFAQTRPSFVDIIALDTPNAIAFRVLHYGKYILVCCAWGKLMWYCFPVAVTYLGQTKPATDSTYTERTPMMRRLRDVPKYFCSEAIRVGLTNCAYNFVERVALDFNRSVPWYNVPALAVRGVYWGGMCLFHGPRAATRVLTEASAATAAATLTAVKTLDISAAVAAGSSNASVLPFLMSRAQIASQLLDAWCYKLGLGLLYQPINASGATLVRESGAQLNGIARLFQLTCGDVAGQSIAKSLTDCGLAVLVHAILPAARKQPTTFYWSQQGVALVCDVASFCVANGLCARIFGATRSEVNVGSWRIPMFVIAFGSNVLSGAFSAFIQQVARNAISRRNYNAAMAATVGPDVSPEAYSEVSRAMLLETSEQLFALCTGREWADLTETEVTHLQSFVWTCCAERVPFNNTVQLGLECLAHSLFVLSDAKPHKDQLIMKAIDSGLLRRLNVDDLHNPVKSFNFAGTTSVMDPSSASFNTTSAGDENALTNTASMTLSCDDPCVVCLRQLKREDDDIVVGTKCNHAYHTTCLRECLNLNANCPLCNTPLLSDAERVPFEQPAFTNASGLPMPRFFASASGTNEVATDIFWRCGGVVHTVVPWAHDVRHLHTYLLGSSCEGNLLNTMIVNGRLDQGLDERNRQAMRLYVQSCAPYSFLFPDPPISQETGDFEQTFATSIGYYITSHIVNLFNADVIFYWDETL